MRGALPAHGISQQHDVAPVQDDVGPPKRAGSLEQDAPGRTDARLFRAGARRGRLRGGLERRGLFRLFDSAAGCWNARLLQLFGIDASLLPVPRPSGTPVARISSAAASRIGLRAGTQVSVGAGDQSAGAVGAGIVRGGLISVSMGTAGAVAAFLDAPVRDAEGRMIVTAHPIKGHWLLEGYQAAAQRLPLVQGAVRRAGSPRCRGRRPQLLRLHERPCLRGTRRIPRTACTPLFRGRWNAPVQSPGPGNDCGAHVLAHPVRHRPGVHGRHHAGHEGHGEL